MAHGVTEVEVLLSVDAGRVPPDAVVFVAADPEAPMRRVYAFLFVTALIGTIGCAFNGAGREAAVLLGIVAAILLVMAIPSALDPEEVGHKRPTLVVTPRGMIVRDAGGLRSWRFDELSDVLPCMHADGEGLLLVRRDGSREFLDCLTFRRGERLAEMIGRRLPRPS
jgi:hypothetical protein